MIRTVPSAAANLENRPAIRLPMLGGRLDYPPLFIIKKR
jgi:hypothetical protein